MRILCKLGLHRWSSKPTHRPGTRVYRCRRCGKRVVRHSVPRHLEKRRLPES